MAVEPALRAASPICFNQGTSRVGLAAVRRACAVLAFVTGVGAAHGAQDCPNAAPPSPPPRIGPSQVSVAFTPASATARSGFVVRQRRTGAVPETPVWLSEDPLVTEAGIESASASLDCDVPALLLTLTADAAERLRVWSASHMGQLLAVTVDGEVLVVANVAGQMGSKTMLPLRGQQPADSERLAKRLMGWKP